MTLKTYYPEMHQEKPQAQMEASMSHYGHHYYIDTPLTLKTSRSIVLLRTYRPEDLTPHGQRKVGWNEYKVTTKAFDTLRQQYDISFEMLLD